MPRLTQRGTTYQVLFYRLLIALLFLSLSRLLFYIFNYHYFSDLDGAELLAAFFGGIRFDITALIILNAPYIFMNVLPFPFRRKRAWQFTANVFYFVLNILGLALNSIDGVYFRFTSKRMTADIFSFLSTGEDDIMTLAPRFISDFALEFFTWLALSLLFIWVALRWKPKEMRKPMGARFYIINTILFLICGAVSIIGIRGGFQLRPITIITAGNYAPAKDVSLVLNTPFTIIKSFGHTGLKEVHYFEDEQDLITQYTPLHYPELNDSSPGFRQYNVVLLIMESFSTEYIGALNGNDENVSYTPFLDSIIAKGMAFPAFANGKQSMEALPAIVASLPSLTTRPYITSAYGSNQINSLANMLGDKGYHTSFYHGGRNGTMGFESFTNIAGFDEYHGKDQYGNNEDFDGNWGIYDEAFLNYFRDELDETQEPFFATFFSLSSHHPYAVPKEYEGKFDKGTLDIHESIMYADYALGKFLQEAESAPWFNNTLFVITADHTSLAYDEKYKTRSGIYEIPLVFYMPGQISPGVKEETAQQTDIMPSVLGFMNFDKPYVAFGNDLFNSGENRFAVNHLNGSYQLIMGGWSLLYDGDKATGLYKLDGFAEQDNLIEDYPEKSDGMLEFLKAYIQQYQNRLIQNKLTITKDNE